MTGGPEVQAGVRWEGKVTFYGWINTVLLGRAELQTSVCLSVGVCVIGVDLAAIFTPLWVNRKKEQLMKYVEYITLEDKFFSFLT